jgi:hypothetical protein
VKNLLARASTVAVCLAVSSAASAGTVAVYSLSGSQPGIGHDPDKPAPTVTSQGFYAKGSSNGGTNGDYNSVRFTPAAIGMAGLKLGDITGASYQAMNLVAGSKDWRLKVYTRNDDSVGWYETRVEAATTTSNTTFTYHSLGAYDRTTLFSGANYYGAAAATAAGMAGNEKVLFFDIIAGASSGGHDYDTYLNNITISARGFETANIVASVVPLPPAAFAGAAMFGVIGLKRVIRICKAKKIA